MGKSDLGSGRPELCAVWGGGGDRLVVGAARGLAVGDRKRSPLDTVVLGQRTFCGKVLLCARVRASV